MCKYVHNHNYLLRVISIIVILAFSMTGQGYSLQGPITSALAIQSLFNPVVDIKTTNGNVVITELNEDARSIFRDNFQSEAEIIYFNLLRDRVKKMGLSQSGVKRVIKEHLDDLHGNKQQVEFPTPIDFKFEFPAKVFSGEQVEAEHRDLLRKRLQRNLFYAGNPQKKQEEILSSCHVLANRTASIIDYFKEHYPQYEIKNISVFGSFLWSDNPNDIDLDIIVKGNACESMEHIEIENFSKIFPKDCGEGRNGISGIDITVIGEDNLVRGDFYNGPERKNIGDVASVINSTRAQLLFRNFVLWGEDFVEPQLPLGNVLPITFSLINNAAQRLNKTYFREETDRKRYRTVLMRLIVASIYLNLISDDRKKINYLEAIEFIETTGKEKNHELDEKSEKWINQFYDVVSGQYETLLRKHLQQTKPETEADVQDEKQATILALDTSWLEDVYSIQHKPFRGEVSSDAYMDLSFDSQPDEDVEQRSRDLEKELLGIAAISDVDVLGATLQEVTHRYVNLARRFKSESEKRESPFSTSFIYYDFHHHTSGWMLESPMRVTGSYNFRLVRQVNDSQEALLSLKIRTKGDSLPVKKEDFSEIVSDVSVLWEELIDNFYIDESGIVQEELLIKEEPNNFHLYGDLTREQELKVYEVLDKHRRLAYFVPGVDLEIRDYVNGIGMSTKPIVGRISVRIVDPTSEEFLEFVRKETAKYVEVEFTLTRQIALNEFLITDLETILHTPEPPKRKEMSAETLKDQIEDLKQENELHYKKLEASKLPLRAIKIMARERIVAEVVLPDEEAYPFAGVVSYAQLGLSSPLDLLNRIGEIYPQIEQLLLTGVAPETLPEQTGFDLIFRPNQRAKNLAEKSIREIGLAEQVDLSVHPKMNTQTPAKNPTANARIKPDVKAAVIDWDGTMLETLSWKKELWAKNWWYITHCTVDDASQEEDLKEGYKFVGETTGRPCIEQMHMLIGIAKQNGHSDEDLSELAVKLANKFKLSQEKIDSIQAEPDIAKRFVIAYNGLQIIYIQSRPKVYIPGAVEFIKELVRNGIEIYIASGITQDVLDVAVRETEIGEILRDKVLKEGESLSSRVIGSPVKKSEVIKAVKKRYGLKSNQVVMIGDSPEDLKYAKTETSMRRALGLGIGEPAKFGALADFTRPDFRDTKALVELLCSSDAREVEKADKIHTENLSLTPSIPDKTIICHIVTDSILPVQQRDILKTLEQEMRDEKYGEKIVSLSMADSVKPEEFMEKLETLKTQIESQYQNYKVQFDVACPGKELVEKVQAKGMKALAFTKDGEGDIIQVEGIMMALRALETGDMNKLLSAYRTLTGEDWTTKATDINQLAKELLFRLPVRKMDVNIIPILNGIIKKNIRSAA